MPVRVHMPSALRGLYHTERVEEIEADSVAEVASALDARYPGIASRLMEPDGSMRRFVNVFVSGDGGRWQAEATTPLDDEAEIWIVQNIAGGVPP